VGMEYQSKVAARKDPCVEILVISTGQSDKFF
jgi:hypothetical protein